AELDFDDLVRRVAGDIDGVADTKQSVAEQKLCATGIDGRDRPLLDVDEEEDAGVVCTVSRILPCGEATIPFKLIPNGPSPSASPESFAPLIADVNAGTRQRNVRAEADGFGLPQVGWVAADPMRVRRLCGVTVWAGRWSSSSRIRRGAV